VTLESNEDGYFVSAIDFAVSIEGEGKNRKVFWSPSFRIHNSLNVEPDPECPTQKFTLDSNILRACVRGA
jgi:hypothetical protein